MSDRWTVSDDWGRTFTFLQRANAHPSERQQALSAWDADWVIETLFGRVRSLDGRSRSILIELAGVPALDGRLYPSDKLTALVKRRAGSRGSLLLISDGRHPRAVGLREDAGSATSSPERRLTLAVMNGRDTFSFEGRDYRVSETWTAASLADRDRFQVVRLDEARALMSRMLARPGLASDERQTLTDAAALVVDRTPAGRAQGLFLLRHLPQPVGSAVRQEPAVTPSRLQELAPRKADIEITFLEIGSGRPIADAPFIFEKPDGSRTRATTSASGSVKLTDLDRGQCVAISVIQGATVATSYAVGGGRGSSAASGKSETAPIKAAYLVEAEVHRVKTGETPESIASEAEVAWETITQFNWETTDPARLQEMFRDRVGCTRKTSDASAYVFADADDPGIILIPRPWQSSFTVGQTHTVFVSPLRTVFVSLENEAGLAIPGAGYEIAFADGSQRRGSLGRSGIARLTGVPDAAFSVCYPDQQDLLARSLAASIRRAFDEQATGPLFYLLGQAPEVIDRAVSVYAECFNDLTGQGLAADIDQVVTDPDARPPLTFLCALAGLGIDGANESTVQDGSSARVEQ